MGALRQLVAAACSCLTPLALSPAVCAGVPNQTVEVLQKSAFRGPGSPGLLPNCQGTFALENWGYSTNTFNNTGATGWNAAAVGGTAPSVTNPKGDIAPDGTMTATDLSIPAVPSGTSNYSILYSTSATASSNFAPFNDWTFQMWVQDTSPSVPGNGFLSVLATNAIGTSPSANANNPTNNPTTGAAFQAIWGTQYANGFASTPIPNDGQPHLVAVWAPAQFARSNIHQYLLSIGVDRRDTTNQTGSVVPTGTKTFRIWHAAFILGHSEGGKGWWPEPPPNDTTTTPSAGATTNITYSCPAGVAYRDFTMFRTWISGTRFANGISQVTIQDQTGAKPYQYGGVGNPFWGSPNAYQLTGTYAGQRCGFSSTTDGTAGSAVNHNDWFDAALYCGQDMWRTAETANPPQIQIPGAVIGTNGSGGAAPCTTGCNSAVSISNVSYNTNGTVTLTLSSSVQFISGLSGAVAGVVGSGTATINGAVTNVQFWIARM